MRFPEGTNFSSKQVAGMYKVFNAQDQTSTFYKIKIENIGSENMYLEQYKLMKLKSYAPKCPKVTPTEAEDNWTGQEEY